MGTSAVRFEGGVVKKQYRYVSLFSGAGGLDIGLERAGLSAISLNEIEEVFCETLRANSSSAHEDGVAYFREAEIIHADVRDLASRDVSLGKEVDLVVGGPPCQAFSSSGKQLSVLDPRGALVSEFCRMISEIKPRMFLFENVRGVVTARDRAGEPGGVIRGLLQAFEEIGYSCRAALLNAADYGAYQRRVRCFIIGSAAGEAPRFPKPTHSREPDLFTQPWKTLGEFFEVHEDLDEAQYVFPTTEAARKLAEVPDGSGLKSPGRKERTRPGGHWGYRQGMFVADQSLPARTVTGSSSQDWVRRNGVLRRITLREAKLLQGFPRDWRIAGSKAQQFKQIGNAVPAVFGETLGQRIVSFLDDYPRSAPVAIELPDSFRGYIEYTKRDQERNAEERVVHRSFG